MRRRKGKPRRCSQGEKGHGGTGEGCGRPPYHVRGHSRRGGPGGACGCGGTGEYEPDPARLANVLKQLVAALHEAGTPQC